MTTGASSSAYRNGYLDNPDRVKYIVRSLYTSKVILETGLMFLHGPVRRAFHSRRTKESGWEAQSQCGSEDRRGFLKEVISVYPEIPLKAFNSCLREGRFFDGWKRQRLVLLRKGDKPLEEASSYRTICLLDTMGKLLEEMILQRLQRLSEDQFGFLDGRSTVEAIQDLADIATKTRRGTGERKGFCELIHINIRNAFNTASWRNCIEALMRKKVPDYLLRMIDVGILEMRINESLWRAKRWLDSRGLKTAPKKTEA